MVFTPAISRLIEALASVCTHVINGKVQSSAQNLFAPDLAALRKKDGGIQLVVVDNDLIRLASNIAVDCIVIL